MELILDSLVDGFFSVLKIAKIILPLMICIEILNDLHIIDKISKFTKPLTNLLSINEKSSIPMTVGLFLGLFYGAGVIIQNVKEDNVDHESVFLICIFLSLCHAVIEDTVIFAAIGANLLPVLLVRLIAAFIITFIISKFSGRELEKID